MPNALKLKSQTAPAADGVPSAQAKAQASLPATPSPKASAASARPVGAAINPYALASLVQGQAIDWRCVEDKPRMLERILGAPYEELFDPRFGGPLYTGQSLGADGLVPARSPLLDVRPPSAVNDVETQALGDLSGVATLADLLGRLGVQKPEQVLLRRADWPHAGRIELSLAVPEPARLAQLSSRYTPDLVRSISVDAKFLVDLLQGWTPPGGHWADAGRFFDETAEFFDPIQGAVANCYFIAALSAVAWALPTRIAQMTRATGQGQQQFVDVLRFYKPDSGGQLDREIEVTETVPLTAWDAPFYARSSEAGEVWPAVYEKAYAKLKTNVQNDHPDITATAWGDPVWATAQLTGGSRAYHATAAHTADQLWTLLRSNCLGGRTFRPMTAWTYASGADAPDRVDYASAAVVGAHAYTVLGWDYRNGQRYILIRNPWGNTEPTVGSLDATSYLWDVSWWRPIALKPVDGVFAMEIATFKRYFAGFGVVTV
ncbi:MAG: hypothetical protein RL722_1343 [Pseudomonadota bacterium]|jgi:hypothetical protein